MFYLVSLLLASIMNTNVEPMLDVHSPSFKNGNDIPRKYTCQGQNINPELKVRDIPEEARSLVIIVEDPDAPSGTFNHWVVWNIKPAKTIRENSKPGTE